MQFFWRYEEEIDLFHLLNICTFYVFLHVTCIFKFLTNVIQIKFRIVRSKKNETFRQTEK